MMNRRNIDIEKRSRRLSEGQRGEGPVVYWMSRDQRIFDNWALLWAQQEALIRRKGLLVVFCVAPDYPGATQNHYSFMLKGLEELQGKFDQFNIGFKLLDQSPEEILPSFLRQIDAHVLVSDFDPLRIKQQWKKQLIDSLAVPVYEVDAHNIIPVWVVSKKKEYAAYTIRPKIRRLLAEYLTDIPALQNHPYNLQKTVINQISRFSKKLARRSAGAENSTKTGEAAAMLAAINFTTHKLKDYSDSRNNPCLDGQSGLSPYLHFGQLSSQRLAWMVSYSELPDETTESFLEELIIRRELSDNFCYYEPAYDRFEGFPEWARKSLDKHRDDQRDHLYSLSEFEEGKTHEHLWNACQQDLVCSGKLHGYLRMYWAKKILEWTSDPETALAYAITLNDRYSLDGRDPNGYAGIAWSIGGVHDRAWRERAVFGKVRYMNEAGCRRKFDVAGYIKAVFDKI
ncbi:MAG: deoxyribodipyrimidine photo-lyase [Desulforhopalus sp.]